MEPLAHSVRVVQQRTNDELVPRERDRLGKDFCEFPAGGGGDDDLADVLLADLAMVSGGVNGSAVACARTKPSSLTLPSGHCRPAASTTD